jgi:hypothetical protein
VIVNLLDNAISFSPPGGRVSVKAKRVGHEIQIAVEDEGPGIPPETLERIFERFYTDRPQESFGQNSGLGLNISRQIVVAHGGRLWAENRHHEGDGRRQERGRCEAFKRRRPLQDPVAGGVGLIKRHVSEARELIHGTCVALGRTRLILRTWQRKRTSRSVFSRCRGTGLEPLLVADDQVWVEGKIMGALSPRHLQPLRVRSR